MIMKESDPFQEALYVKCLVEEDTKCFLKIEKGSHGNRSTRNIKTIETFWHGNANSVTSRVFITFYKNMANKNFTQRNSGDKQGTETIIEQGTNRFSRVKRGLVFQHTIFASPKWPLREICPNTEFFSRRDSPYFDWILRFTEFISSFRPAFRQMLLKKVSTMRERGMPRTKKETLADQYFRVQSSSFSSFIVLNEKGYKSSALLIIQPVYTDILSKGGGFQNQKVWRITKEIWIFFWGGTCFLHFL